MIPVARPCWGREEEEAMLRVARSGRLIAGPEVAAFERAVAEYVGTKHAVACSSGTTALHLALMAMGVGPGDEVLVPAFTFVATANAVLMCGARARLCDVSIETFCMFPTFVAFEGCKIGIPVHAFGTPAIWPHEMPALEDAACALGSFKGLAGKAAIFSFHATKTITTGEGGMVVTNDEEIARKCRFLRDQKHGQGLAYNYRMTEMQGAIGVEQMKRLPEFLRERAEIAALYDAEFDGHIAARIPPKGGNYQSYVLLLAARQDRAKVIAALAERGVEALPGTQYLGAMPHLNPEGRDYLNARIAGERAMRIPMWPWLTDEEVEQVIEAVKGVLG